MRAYKIVVMDLLAAQKRCRPRSAHVKLTRWKRWECAVCKACVDYASFAGWQIQGHTWASWMEYIFNNLFEKLVQFFLLADYWHSTVMVFVMDPPPFYLISLSTQVSQLESAVTKDCSKVNVDYMWPTRVHSVQGLARIQPSSVAELCSNDSDPISLKLEFRTSHSALTKSRVSYLNHRCAAPVEKIFFPSIFIERLT